MRETVRERHAHCLETNSYHSNLLAGDGEYAQAHDIYYTEYRTKEK